MRPRACNFLLELLQMKETCWSKLSSESIKIPSKVSYVLVVSEASPIDTSVGDLELKRNLAIRNGWFIQSNALERSVRRAPNSLPLSIASLNFSIITRRQC